MTQRSAYVLPGLNDLAAAINYWADRKGFHEPNRVRDFDGMIANVHSEASEALEEWRAGRGMTEYHWTVKGHEGLMGEVLRWIDGRLHVRNEEFDLQQGLRDPAIPEYLEMTPELLRRMPNMIRHLKPEGIPAELADVLIRVLHMCAFFGIDIEAAIADKMAFNETRPHRNGGKRS